jgi:hypothetical protein
MHTFAGCTQLNCRRALKRQAGKRDQTKSLLKMTACVQEVLYIEKAKAFTITPHLSYHTVYISGTAKDGVCKYNFFYRVVTLKSKESEDGKDGKSF